MLIEPELAVNLLAPAIWAVDPDELDWLSFVLEEEADLFDDGADLPEDEADLFDDEVDLPLLGVPLA